MLQRKKSESTSLEEQVTYNLIAASTTARLESTKQQAMRRMGYGNLLIPSSNLVQTTDKTFTLTKNLLPNPVIALDRPAENEDLCDRRKTHLIKHDYINQFYPIKIKIFFSYIYKSGF